MNEQGESAEVSLKTRGQCQYIMVLRQIGTVAFYPPCGRWQAFSNRFQPFCMATNEAEHSTLCRECRENGLTDAATGSYDKRDLIDKYRATWRAYAL